MTHLNSTRLFSVVNCHGSDDGWYDIFIGCEALKPIEQKKLELRQVQYRPAEWYAGGSDRLQSGARKSVPSALEDFLGVYRDLLAEGVQAGQIASVWL